MTPDYIIEKTEIPTKQMQIFLGRWVLSVRISLVALGSDGQEYCLFKKKKKHSVAFMHSVKLGVGDAKVVAQTVEPSPSIHKGQAQLSCLNKDGSTKLESQCSTGGGRKPGVQDRSWLLNEFRSSMRLHKTPA